MRVEEGCISHESALSSFSTHSGGVHALDPLLFREEKGGNPELVRESQRRRHASVEIVDEIIARWDKQRGDSKCGPAMWSEVHDLRCTCSTRALPARRHPLNPKP